MNAESVLSLSVHPNEIRASMEPRLNERGMMMACRKEFVMPSELQWSRVSMNAECIRQLERSNNAYSASMEPRLNERGM